MTALEALGDVMQGRIVAALRLNFGNGGKNIVAVRPGSAMTLSYQMQLAFQVEAPGVLRMATVYQEHEGTHVAGRLCRRGTERNASRAFKVDLGYLLALAQIRHGCVPLCRRHPIGDAAASAAAVEAKHQTRFLRGAAVDEGIDAQGAVEADEARRYALQEVEPRPPHERTVTKHPKIVVGQAG